MWFQPRREHTGATQYVSDDSDFGSDEEGGEFYDPDDEGATGEGRLGTQDSVMSEDEAGDDGASLYGDFLVDEVDDDDENVSVAGGSSRRPQTGGCRSGYGSTQEVDLSVDGLLEDLTNLSVTEIGPRPEQGGRKRRETGTKNKKKSTVPKGGTAKASSSEKGWSVSISNPILISTRHYPHLLYSSSSSILSSPNLVTG